MEFNFPIYPFVWDYNDMYNYLDHSSEILDKNDLDDDNLVTLNNIFNNYEIININQKILKNNAKNISIHTWYLKNKNLFEIENKNLKIITNSKIKFKDTVPCLIFDPNNLFERTEYNKDNITIVKDINSIKKDLIPNLYIHTHNIKGIFRFSPNNNNKIIFNSLINEGTFYIILNNLLIKFNILFI